MYKVYKVNSKTYYKGLSLVAANNADDANRIIKRFQEEDPSNKYDSWGYEIVTELDVIDDVFSERYGIVLAGIYYYG